MALSTKTQGSKDLLCSSKKVVSTQLAGLLLYCEAVRRQKQANLDKRANPINLFVLKEVALLSCRINTIA